MSDAAQNIPALDEEAIQLRIGGEADLPAVVELSRMMVEEFPRWQGLKFDGEKAMEAGRRFFARTHTLMLVAHDENRGLVGFFTGTLEDYDFAQDGYGQEHMWYLLPELRGGKLHAFMFQIFERWAMRHGAREIYNSMFLSSDKADGMDQWMRRNGYQRLGGTYWKRLRETNGQR